MTRLDALNEAVKPLGLFVSGACHTYSEEAVGRGTVALLTPDEGFWEVFQTSPEFEDQQADPMDRWSVRVVNALADQLAAQAVFPFGGPPYMPFMSWAQRSGEAFASPIHFLVHQRAGLWLSWRGALFWPEHMALPTAEYVSPCLSCADQPCINTCPVFAFSAEGYNTKACHDWLDDPRNDCMELGCAARRACPVGKSLERPAAQSAYHMRQFHKN